MGSRFPDYPTSGQGPGVSQCDSGHFTLKSSNAVFRGTPALSRAASHATAGVEGFTVTSGNGVVKRMANGLQAVYFQISLGAVGGDEEAPVLESAQEAAGPPFGVKIGGDQGRQALAAALI